MADRNIKALGAPFRARFGSLTDEEIRLGIESDPEIHPTDADFWKDARVVMPRPKETITMSLDVDLLEWLRKQESYQARINAVLRTYMEASKNRNL